METVGLLKTHLARMTMVVTIFFSLAAMSGCRTIRVSEADFLLPNVPPETSLRGGQAIERFTIETSHGSLAATRISAPGNRTAVLYCGGNQFRTKVLGGSIGAAFPSSVDLIMFDYPGYGDSTGTPTVENIMDSAAIVYDRLIGEAGKKYERRVVYGASMGSFIASDVASRRNPDMLVLEGAAASAPQMMKSLVPWFAKPFVSFDIAPSLARIDNVEKLQGFRGGVLFLVGSADAQTKPAVMREFADSLRSRGVDVQFHVIPGRGHGNVLDDSRARDVIRAFVEGEP